MPSCMVTACHEDGAGYSPIVAVSQEDIDHDCAIGRAAHRRLIAQLDERIGSGEFDADAASVLPGWTKGMIVTHVARNADGHSRMFDGAAIGEVWEQYDGGVENRTSGIEAGRGVGAREVLDDLRRAVERLEQAWSTTDWLGSGRRTLSQQTPIIELPFLRAREVELHHIDLGIAYTFDDLDPSFVEAVNEQLERSWSVRQLSGDPALPRAAQRLEPPRRLAWLTGRLVVDGLPPAGIF